MPVFATFYSYIPYAYFLHYKLLSRKVTFRLLRMYTNDKCFSRIDFGHFLEKNSILRMIESYLDSTVGTTAKHTP